MGRRGSCQGSECVLRTAGWCRVSARLTLCSGGPPEAPRCAPVPGQGTPYPGHVRRPAGARTCQQGCICPARRAGLVALEEHCGPLTLAQTQPSFPGTTARPQACRAPSQLPQTQGPALLEHLGRQTLVRHVGCQVLGLCHRPTPHSGCDPSWSPAPAISTLPVSWTWMASARALEEQETHPCSGCPFHLGGILGLRLVLRSLIREVQVGEVCVYVGQCPWGPDGIWALPGA